MGMRGLCRELFDGIEWGGAEVTAQTMANATAAGLSVRTLPTWYDVDRIEDARRACCDLARSERRPEADALYRVLLSLGIDS